MPAPPCRGKTQTASLKLKPLFRIFSSYLPSCVKAARGLVSMVTDKFFEKEKKK